jgi:hypothetical protein
MVQWVLLDQVNLLNHQEQVVHLDLLVQQVLQVPLDLQITVHQVEQVVLQDQLAPQVMQVQVI